MRFLLALRFLCFLPLAGLLMAAAPLSPAQQELLAQGYRFQRAGWVYLHAEGSPRARGFQHGFLLAPEIAASLRKTRLTWEYMSALPWSWFVAKADAMFTAKVDPENLAELDGMAEGLEAAGLASSRAELVAYNAQTELFGYWWPQEFRKLKADAKVPVPESCSSFIATGSWTADGGIVLGHNTMQDYQLAPPNVVLDLVPEKGQRILMQTTPGWIHSGTDFWVTSAGLVGSETTIGQFEGFDPSGIPEFSRMRRASQDATTIDDWCRIMKEGNNGGYANAWLLGDVNSGEIARLELGLKVVSFERTKDGYFTGSNIAENQKLLRYETTSNELDIRASNVARRVRWKQLMAQHKGKIDLKLARHFEAEHIDAFYGKERVGGRCLCAHHELEREPAGPWPGVPYGPAGTLDGKVLDSQMAKAMSFSARWGAACGRPFRAADFLAKHPQFSWMTGILDDRPTQSWTTFKAGDRK
jgi:hypothetical protein